MQAEQELANPATNLTAAASYDEVMRLVRSPGMNGRDKIRLVMLYTLRFESDAARVRQLQDFLVTAGVRDRWVRITLLRCAGVWDRWARTAS